MREDVIILPFVPRAIRKQAPREMRGDAGRTEDGVLDERVVAEKPSRRKKRRRVPYLAI
jgi:hypothetical protein